MIMHVTCHGLVEPSPTPTRRFRIAATQDLTGSTLAQALHGLGLPSPLFLDSQRLDKADELPSRGNLTLTPSPDSQNSSLSLPTLWLVTLSGPDAGRALPLQRGDYSIGRQNTALAVLDPALSRTEAVLSVRTNGLFLSIQGGAPQAIHVDSNFVLGNTTFGVLDRPDWGSSPSLASTWPLNAHEFARGITKTRPWLLLTAALAPVCIAVALALSTGSWFLLAFSALGLLTGGIPAGLELASRRRVRAAIRQAATDDARRLEALCPSLGVLALRILETAAASRRGDRPSAPVTATQAESVEAVPLRIGTGPVRPALRFHTGEAPEQIPTSVGPCLIPLTPGSIGAVPASVAMAAVIRLAHAAANGSLALHVSPHCDLPVELALVPGVHVGAPQGTTTVPTVWVISTGERANLASVAEQGGTRSSWSSPAIIVYDGDALPTDTWSVTAQTPIPALGPHNTHALTTIEGVVSFGADGCHLQTLRRVADALASLPRRPSAARTLPSNVTWRPRDEPWTESSVESLHAPIGQSLDASEGSAVSWRDLDLVADGPHALVAGTTGSGKSELLRTMLSGLLHRYGPEDLALLLIDFKGGATLAPFADAPHTHGLMTDLSEASATRFLDALMHELRRRERVLQRAGATSYAQGRCSTTDFLPRLLVVVDEFRVLAEEIPEAMGELMRIATVGRSLGVHLLLATQRPQGVVSAEMRANLNAVMCLRVLSEFESRDLLGSGDAARIPPGLPGRGYLRLAGGPPEPFQSAVVGDGHLQISVEELGERLGEVLDTRLLRVDLPQDRTLEVGAKRSVPALFSPGLPERIAPPAAKAPESDLVFLGLTDDVAQQRHERLYWSMNMRRIALVGGPRSGTSNIASHLLRSVACLRTEHHVYVLDGTGDLVDAATDYPRMSGWARPDDAARLDELLDVIDAGTHGNGTFETPTVILVNSLAAWASSLTPQQFARLEECLARWARTAERRQLALCVAGDRDLLTSRFFALAEHRFYCPAGLSRETVMLWPKLLPIEPRRGHFAYLGPDTPEVGLAVQLITENPPVVDAPPQPAHPQRRAIPLPIEPLGSQATDRVRLDPGEDALLSLGLRAPDSSDWWWRPGQLALILGAAGTGKSALLTSIDLLLTDEEMLLVDNADRLGPSERQAVEAAHAAGRRIVMTATPGPHLYSSLPCSAAARQLTNGILLGPRAATDGDFWGWRLDSFVGRAPSSGTPAGRGVALIEGRLTRIQAFSPPASERGT